jgi:hypothetical protein
MTELDYPEKNSLWCNKIKTQAVYEVTNCEYQEVIYKKYGDTSFKRFSKSLELWHYHNRILTADEVLSVTGGIF